MLKKGIISDNIYIYYGINIYNLNHGYEFNVKVYIKKQFNN